MELLLNIFWLLIAAASVLGTWIRQWRRGTSGRQLPLCALGCVLVLLFPVISASDDLHAAALAVEASDFSRKIVKSIVLSGASAHTWPHVLPSVLLLALFSAAATKLVDTVTEQRISLPVTGFNHQVHGRAPPSGLFLA